MTDCPSAATLSRALRDSRECETFDAVEAHVEGCASCRELLDRIRLNDGVGAGGELPSTGAHPEIHGFEILRVLGCGGMGVVYLARQKNADRLVALKVVRSGPAAGSRERERWLREARAFSRVRHDNVVRLFEFGESGGWLYLVLDYIPGGTVEETLKVPYSAKDAARFLHAVAEAVSAIHGAGLLHLDLKPSNIFLDRPEDMPRELAMPRVGDFGIARRWGEAGASVATASLGSPVGSPSHMAPEQITADRSKLGPTADVYGLGAVLYHVLTGRPPFSAPSIVETLDQVRNVDPVSPRRFNPKIPRDLDTICLKCLEKDPRSRYPTAAAVAEDLRSWLDGRPIQARPTSIPMRGLRWCLRRPVIASLLGLLILTIGTSFTSVLILWRHAESARKTAVFERGRAESARQKAEAEEALATKNVYITREVSNQLLKIIIGTLIQNYPIRKKGDELLEAYKLMKRNIHGTKHDQTIEHSESYELGTMGMFISCFLEKDGRFREAGVLAEDARRLFAECLSMNGVNDMDLNHSGWALMVRGSCEFAESHVDEALAIYGEHARLIPLIVDEKLRRDNIRYMSDNMLNGANRLRDKGDIAAVVRILSEDLKFLDFQLPGDMSLPTFIELRERARVLKVQMQTGLAASEKMLAERKTDEERGRERKIADEIARENPIAKGLDSADPSASKWIERVLTSIQARCRSHGMSVSFIPRVGWNLRHSYLMEMTNLRRAGNIVGAEKAADRFFSFAQRIVGDYPRSAEAYLVLNEAYLQFSKNAFARDDMKAFRRWTQESLNVSIRASDLDSDNADAMSQIEYLRSKLSKMDRN